MERSSRLLPWKTRSSRSKVTVSSVVSYKINLSLNSSSALDASLQYLYSSNECYTGSGGCGTLAGYGTSMSLLITWQYLLTLLQISPTLQLRWARPTQTLPMSWVSIVSLTLPSSPLMVVSPGKLTELQSLALTLTLHLILRSIRRSYDLEDITTLLNIRALINQFNALMPYIPWKLCNKHIRP